MKKRVGKIGAMTVKCFNVNQNITPSETDNENIQLTINKWRRRYDVNNKVKYWTNSERLSNTNHTP